MKYSGHIKKHFTGEEKDFNNRSITEIAAIVGKTRQHIHLLYKTWKDTIINGYNPLPLQGKPKTADSEMIEPITIYIKVV